MGSTLSRMRPRTTLVLPNHNICPKPMWAAGLAQQSYWLGRSWILAENVQTLQQHKLVKLPVSEGSAVGSASSPAGAKTSQVWAAVFFPIALCCGPFCILVMNWFSGVGCRFYSSSNELCCVACHHRREHFAHHSSAQRASASDFLYFLSLFNHLTYQPQLSGAFDGCIFCSDNWHVHLKRTPLHMTLSDIAQNFVAWEMLNAKIEILGKIVKANQTIIISKFLAAQISHPCWAAEARDSVVPGSSEFLQRRVLCRHRARDRDVIWCYKIEQVEDKMEMNHSQSYTYIYDIW